MATRPATLKEIRHILSHGEGNRRVRISKDGHVTYYGSPDPSNRQHDYWHEGRWVEEYKIIEEVYKPSEDPEARGFVKSWTDIGIRP